MGSGLLIRILECIKCYRSSLEKLVQDKPKYKGKGKLTEIMRKRLTTAARCAIKMRSAKPHTDKKQGNNAASERSTNGRSKVVVQINAKKHKLATATQLKILHT